MNISRTYMKLKSKAWDTFRLEARLQDWDDERYLKLHYWIRMGRPLSLASPEAFSEKLQWLKLNDRRPIYTTLVDKYEVKRWVAERIGEDHIVPNLGVWDSFDEIDFSTLPEQFVLKCTHDSGGLVICDDRATFDLAAARAKINRSLERNYYYGWREWPYRDVRPRIIAECYLPGSDQATRGKVLFDFKFYCFHGEPQFLYVSCGLDSSKTAKMEFVTLDWKPTGFTRPDYRGLGGLPSPPSCLRSMIAISRELAAGIPFVRVDLYEHCGAVLFSEMTLTPAGGTMQVRPRSADLEIGKLIDLSLVGVT